MRNLRQNLHHTESSTSPFTARNPEREQDEEIRGILVYSNIRMK